MTKYASTLIVLSLLLGPDRVEARRQSDLKTLRAYFDSEGLARRPLKRRLRRLGVSRLLSLMRRIEPHVRQPKKMQRFETKAGAYYVIPPKRYSPRRAWPLHIALHGHGSSQSGRVACTRYWKGEPARAGVILACPDRRGKWNTKAGEALVIATYKDVQQRFNIRTDKVSLGGFSGGGIGAWIVGPRYPDLFSALVPRAGIPPRAEALIENLNGLDLFMIHGRGDPTISVKKSRKVVQKLKTLKINHTYRELSGGHEFFQRLNSEVIRWLKGRSRPLRRRFRYHGRLSGAPRIIHWLQASSSGTVTIRGQIIKRRRVIITVDRPERLTGLTVYLSRKNFDMRRGYVDVSFNGRSRRYKVRESPDAVLDSYEMTRDLRRVFTARAKMTRRHRGP